MSVCIVISNFSKSYTIFKSLVINKHLKYNYIVKDTTYNSLDGGIDMDIASLSMAMSTSKLSSDVGIAVLGKSLDSLKQAGDGMLKIMESSVTPNLGQNIDYSA